MTLIRTWIESPHQNRGVDRRWPDAHTPEPVAAIYRDMVTQWTEHLDRLTPHSP